MSLTLRIDSGPRAETTFTLVPGTPLSVGRMPNAEVSLPDDQFVSGLHLELAFDGKTCTLRDLNSRNGTLLNGIRVSEAPLRPGDRFTAGQTAFRLLENADPYPVTQAPQADTLDPAARMHLLKDMRTNLQPLYAILDAAHDPRILATLIQLGPQYISLFDGSTPPQLRQFSPYLVALPPESPVIKTLIDIGWGQNWGIFLSSTAGGSELLGVLRRLLIANLPDGEQALLRFYDPRVLRALLAAPSEQQCAAFFSRVRSYLVEGQLPQTATGFIHADSGLERIDIHLVEHCTVTRTLIAVTPSAGGGNREVTLSASQVSHLKANERDARIGRLVQAIRREHPQQGLLTDKKELSELVLYGSEHSQRYGISSDKDVADYISLMIELGRNFDQDTHLPWASKLLQERMAPNKKLSRLKEMAYLEGSSKT